MISPVPKATCAATAKPSATARPANAPRAGPSRAVASAPTVPSRTISSPSSQPGAARRGKPSSTVWIAAAWISGPDMRSSLAVEVAKTSFSTGAVAPTTTTLPRSTRAGTWPRRTSPKETVRIVRGGPG